VGQRERDCWSVRQRYVLEGGEGRRLWGRNSEEQTLGPVVVQGHFSNQYGLFRLPNAFRAFLALPTLAGSSPWI